MTEALCLYNYSSCPIAGYIRWKIHISKMDLRIDEWIQNCNLNLFNSIHQSFHALFLLKIGFFLLSANLFRSVSLVFWSLRYMNTILINIEELLKLHYSNVYCFFIREKKKNSIFFIWLFWGRFKPEENKRKKKNHLKDFAVQ